MTELIMKMILCLVVALILGFIIGWLLTKISQSKKHLLDMDVLSSTLDDRNDRIDMLEKEFTDKESMLLRFQHTNRELKASLEEKTTLLNEKSHRLTKLQQQLNVAENFVSENLSAKEDKQALLEQIDQLEREANGRVKEIQELETVLIKAENTIEEKQNLFLNRDAQLAALTLKGTEISGVFSDDGSIIDNSEAIETLQNKIEELNLVNKEKEKTMALYRETIGELEQELKLYSINGEEDEFVISKDQFTHIEEQLVDYQKEITILKEENSHLLQVTKSEGSSEKSEATDMDDIAIVKLFRETYKKITKS